MNITSPAFDADGIIPERFSQNDANRSLPLDFNDVPPEAQSLVLIMDDPDAPHGTFTHWVVFDLDPKEGGLGENQRPENARPGLNDYKQAAYAGPKPPDGEHRYFLKLYALNRRLSLPKGATRQMVEQAMNGFVIAEAHLMGRYATPVGTR